VSDGETCGKRSALDLWPLARDRCYDFKNIFAQKFGKKFGVFLLKLLTVFAKI
jgi:hypothetical protein